MYNAPYQGVADDLAKYGRYGDSMLVHMNPIEVGILASLSPTGELTTNPVTGQKEAFLPFLAPLLGSFLGTSLLSGSTLGGLLGSGLSKAAAGAIGSGLATTAATGDLKEGILSGITGFGLGKVFGAMGAGDATKILPDAANAAPIGDLMGPPDVASGMGGSFTAPPASGFNFSAAGQELMKPGTFLPIYAGTSATEGIRQQEELDRLMKEQGLSDEEAKRKYEEDARRAIETVQRLYPQMRPKGMAAGGQVEGYQVGGRFSSQPSYSAPRQRTNLGGMSFDEQYGLNNMSGGFYDTQFGQTSPSDIQGRLRGPVSVAAPYASYGALDVGGQGYLPGIAPEFQYFRQPEEVYPQPPLTMGRGKGGGFGGGMGGGRGRFSGMPGGKGSGMSYGGGYDDYGYGGGYGSPYGGGYSSMPSKGGYANPRNSMGFGGYNTGFTPSYGGSYGGFGDPFGGGFGGYDDSFMRFMR